MYKFQSERAKHWAEEADLMMVGRVRRQLASFCAQTKQGDVYLGGEKDPPEDTMPIADIARALRMSHETIGRWVRDGYVLSAGKFVVKRNKTSRLEIFTWPWLVIVAIERKNQAKSGGVKTEWVGWDALEDRGLGEWGIEAMGVLGWLD